MCISHIPPEGSTYGINVLESIENNVILYRDKGHIILCGDMNARTRCEKDYIENDSNDGINVYDNYSPDFSISDWVNEDKTLCDRGKQLLDMCISYRMRIVNGRTVGDSTGKFTCYMYNGNSTIDYFIFSECLFNDILSFHVNDVFPKLSDHSKISLRLAASVNLVENKVQMTEFPCNFIWKKDSEESYKKAFQSDLIKDKIKNLCIDIETPDIDTHVENLNTIFKLAASLSMKLEKKNKKKLLLNHRNGMILI